MQPADPGGGRCEWEMSSRFALPLLRARRARRRVRAELFRSVSGFRDAAGPRADADPRHPLPRCRRPRTSSPKREAGPRWRSVVVRAIRAAPGAPERPPGHTRGDPHRVRKHARDEHRRPARAAGSAWSAPRCRTASSPGCTTERRPPLPPRRLLAARGPVRPPARAAQGRARDPPRSRWPSAAPAPRRPPGRFAVTDKLRGGELRALLRLLHPRPERPPAEASGRLAGRQPHRDPRHRTRPARSARRPRPDAFAPRIPTSKS